MQGRHFIQTIGIETEPDGQPRRLDTPRARSLVHQVLRSPRQQIRHALQQRPRTCFIPAQYQRL